MPSTTTHALPTNPRLSGFQSAAAPPGFASAIAATDACTCLSRLRSPPSDSSACSIAARSRSETSFIT
ncbi:MAG: hypothetical protein HUU26_15055 [Gemmatimonadaceae bacterium]|nr:hypothetical protein [Gemmatimonadaceae bacterium]